ncbi:hypothetical protein Hdeb2414_s0004g00138631 [Helianthus debilis subsp. tardiflorus]
MCEICGGPHFTVKCLQYEGSPVDYCTNPFVQPHQYSSQGYSTNTSERFPHFFKLMEVIMICVQTIKEFQECGDPRCNIRQNGLSKSDPF